MKCFQFYPCITQLLLGGRISTSILHFIGQEPLGKNKKTAAIIYPNLYSWSSLPQLLLRSTHFNMELILLSKFPKPVRKNQLFLLSSCQLLKWSHVLKVHNLVQPLPAVLISLRKDRQTSALSSLYGTIRVN